VSIPPMKQRVTFKIREATEVDISIIMDLAK
jgi:hypothetical protein